eukprot:TRINITY_DN1431_c0_g1_i2.p1 TRINITY_DN1431_c0_g1~~TRINITY_DN1431_c0_g1_i2.p1  ORF type:complete len:497 (+),score=76.63 TRINITY_DN1431_c0_g1_i2:83-1492(+)
MALESSAAADGRTAAPGDGGSAAPRLPPEAALAAPASPAAYAAGSTDGAESSPATEALQVQIPVVTARMVSLLKVSPPVPVGRHPGHFKVRLVRACLSQPFGLSFGRNGTVVIVNEDAPHLGIHRGDEVLQIAALPPPTSVRSCVEALEMQTDVEIRLLRREIPGAHDSWSCSETSEPVRCEGCFQPPVSRCTARNWFLQSALKSSGPIPQEGGRFLLKLARMSMKQSYGLNVCVAGQLLLLSNGFTKGGRSPSAQTASFTGATTSVGSFEDATSIDPEQASSARSGFSGYGDRAEETASRESEDFARLGTDSALSSPGTLREGGESSRRSCSTPAGSLIVDRDHPHYGLLKGDRILRVNGLVPKGTSDFKAILRRAPTIILEMSRPEEESTPVSSSHVMQLTDIDSLAARPQKSSFEQILEQFKACMSCDLFCNTNAAITYVDWSFEPGSHVSSIPLRENELAEVVQP